jgi:hypothetical protein
VDSKHDDDDYCQAGQIDVSESGNVSIIVALIALIAAIISSVLSFISNKRNAEYRKTSEGAMKRQHQPPCPVPCTRTKVTMLPNDHSSMSILGQVYLIDEMR